MHRGLRHILFASLVVGCLLPAFANADDLSMSLRLLAFNDLSESFLEQSGEEEEPGVIDRHGPQIGIAMLLLLLAFVYPLYRAFPCPGQWIEGASGRAIPPEGHSPGGARFFLMNRYDMRCWLADMAGLWDKGLLSITPENETGGSLWVFRRLEASPKVLLLAGEAFLWDRYFKEKKALHIRFNQLSRDFRFWDAIEAHEKFLKKFYRPRYCSFRFLSLGMTLLLSIGVGAAAVAMANATLLYIIFPLWIANLLVPWVFRSRVVRYSPEGKKLFSELFSYKKNFPLLPADLPKVSAEDPFSFGWAVAFEEERGWWADLSLQVDYAGNMRDLRTRELTTVYQSNKSYAREQVGKMLASRLGQNWQRQNPPL